MEPSLPCKIGECENVRFIADFNGRSVIAIFVEATALAEETRVNQSEKSMRVQMK